MTKTIYIYTYTHTHTYIHTYMKVKEESEKVGLKLNNNPVYETAKETLMYRTVFWTLWERERVG